MSAIARKMRSTSTSGVGTISELWRGHVVEVFEDGSAMLVVPHLGGDDPIDRVPSLVRNLARGARVVVGAIEGRVDDLVVLSAVSDEGLVIGDARFTYVLLDNEPTAAEHAVRKSYADALGSVLPSPDTIVRRGVTGSIIVQDAYLGGVQTAGNAATTKSYVDAQIATRSAAGHTHAYSSLTGIPATFAPSAHTHPWADVTGKPATFAPSAHRHPWADLDNVPATFAPSAHSHPASEISDASTVGRNVLKALDAAAARAAIGAGTSSLVIGTSSTTAMRGDRTFTFAEIGGTVSTAQLPPLAINEVFSPVADQTAMLALTAQRGDMAIRSDNGRTYVLSSDSPSTLADWKEVMAAGQVQSVAGKSGVVLLVKADVGLGNVDNTSDLLKPISNATQAALNNKSNVGHTHTKSEVGLDQVDNTADVDKPISTLQQAALNGKSDIAHTHELSALSGKITNAQLPVSEDIPDAADLNTYTTTGVYSQGFNARAATGSNYPEAQAGLFEVRTRGDGSMVFQRYTIYNTGREYVRTKYQSTWYSWVESSATEAGTGVTFSNGWTNFNATAYGSMKTVRSGGSVTLSGMPKPGTISEGVVVATITAAHRPAKDAYMGCIARTTVPSNVACLLVVRATGAVEVFGAPSTTSYLNIGLSFVQANG
ncbi:minor tail protein [Arthrobacter phage EastWest]|uniref:Minor tail protein n=1 Tax=Arthrobacter phage EastWest TaxID=2894292 RepID=A0AAE9C9M8_9CAUD|nr:minor tail protein [Arthrobacter phage EastWest]